MSSLTPSKVSIIMPAYNQAMYISETIKSIQNQTFNNWELIIVDDGSDDDTENIVRQLNDDRIIFLKAGRIGKGGKIKNIGLEKASGNLIAFIDSDDLWAPTKIEKQLNALEQYQDAGFCLTGGYNFKKTGEPLDYFYSKRTGLEYAHFFNSYFRSEVAGFTQALMFRKQCLLKTGPFKEVKRFSDVDFIISLCLHFKGVILYEPLVFRRLHEKNYINDSTWEKSYVEAIEIIKEYTGKNILSESIARDALFRLNVNFGEGYLLRGKPAKAIHRFLRAWINKPFSIIPLKKMAKSVLQYIKKPGGD